MSDPAPAPRGHGEASSPFRLTDGSRVAVIGGGPAGSFFSYFLLTMAERIGLDLQVDVYEPRDFARPGPAGCNMCGGIVSESMVQLLAAEGIILPPTVVQRGIDSYVLHMDVGHVRIDTPRNEKRIAAIHRGAGPRGVRETRWGSLDGHLLNLAAEKGATIVRKRVEGVSWPKGRPRIATTDGISEDYDLVGAAVGINGARARLFEGTVKGYRSPRTTKTRILELFLGSETIERYLGSAMHVFLLGLPRLEFAAIIPKGEYATVCLLGRDVDDDLVRSFLEAPEVKRCLPPGWSPPEDFCRCAPSINVRGAPQPFGDRLVFIGDSGVTRLYKDGIGGAYRAAKAAAKTALFQGVSAADFRRHYLPFCRLMEADNDVGRIVFAITRLIRSVRPARGGLLRMTSREQEAPGVERRMSGVLWDTFTGSAPYRDVFLRTLHPLFLGRFLFDIAADMWPFRISLRAWEGRMAFGDMGTLGKVYKAGEVIVRQGETGDCMYIIQSGKVEVVTESAGEEIHLAELGEGDFFGEMALFEKGTRSATVRPLGEVRVLTVDRKMFLRKIHEDPSLAFRIMEKMSKRIRELDEEIARTKSAAEAFR